MIKVVGGKSKVWGWYEGVKASSRDGDISDVE
jgi:hypothetical protein